MCWGAEATATMVVVGGVAAAVAWHKEARPAVWLTLGYFVVMEALQFIGYTVIDQCDSTTNQSVTTLSYLHIALQPIFINAFAMELVPNSVRERVQPWVYAVAGMSALVMLVQLLPIQALGDCRPGDAMCADQLCTVSGSWHIAWEIPYNGLMAPVDNLLGTEMAFPTYMGVVFLMPLLYGAWRFVMLHMFVGPILAWTLTENPSEMPAIWCLFSIAILLITLNTQAQTAVRAETWWGVRV